MKEQEKEKLLNLLYDILTSEPEGIKEFDLVSRLREKKINFFDFENLQDPVVLFRCHFLLFHLLYTLRDRLREEGRGDLEIHCLKISLRPFQSSSDLIPEVKDTLQEYYLDFKHMEEVVKEDVEKMIDSFWDKYAKFNLRTEALAVLNLEAAATEEDIKKRYRKLVLDHHPDRGGDATEFNQIIEAMEVLR